ncbi:hypothetical protein ACWDO3_31105, partial [Streptomyces hydrogenans]
DLSLVAEEAAETLLPLAERRGIALAHRHRGTLDRGTGRARGAGKAAAGPAGLRPRRTGSGPGR